jgi:hypothetical protein
VQLSKQCIIKHLRNNLSSKSLLFLYRELPQIKIVTRQTNFENSANTRQQTFKGFCQKEKVYPCLKALSITNRRMANPKSLCSQASDEMGIEATNEPLDPAYLTPNQR